MNATAADYLRDLIGRLLAAGTEVSPEEQYLSLDLNLKVIALVAASDGGVHEAEVRLAQEVRAADADHVVTEAAMRKAVEAVVDDEESVWRQLAAARSLDVRLREDLYLSARLAAAIDSEIHPAEKALLNRIGDALALSMGQRAELDSRATGVAPTPVPAGGRPERARSLRALMSSRGGRKLRRIFAGFLAKRGDLTPEQEDLALDLTIKAVALVAAAEDDVHEAEVRAIGEIYAALGGGAVSAAMLTRAIGVVRSTTHSTWNDFHKAQNLAINTRRDILRAARSVAHADDRVHAKEAEVLTKLGRQLGFSDAETAACVG